MRVLTIPNLLTMLRLVASPAVPVILIYQLDVWDVDFRLIAFALALALALTDLFDGLFAKWLQQESAFGRWLDPIADFFYSCSLFVSVFVIYLHFSILVLTCWMFFACYFLWYAKESRRLRKAGLIESPSRNAKRGMGALMISTLLVILGTFVTPVYLWHILAVVGVAASICLTLDALDEYRKSLRCTNCTCEKC